MLETSTETADAPRERSVRWFTVPPAGGAIPFPMTSHLHKTGFSGYSDLKKKKSAA